VKQSYAIPGRTSTPINDITVSLKEGRTAILFLDNNEHIVNESPDEERIYSTTDFQAALTAEGMLSMNAPCANANVKQLAGSKFKLPFAKSKKLFSLVELGQAMQAVRSPSMIASSIRLSTDHSKLFSIRDFERAVVKLRNRKQSKSSTAAAEVETEPQGADVTKDQAAGGSSSDAESEKGSSQDKANDELHITTETTEHSQGQYLLLFLCNF
jgi:hypothetical protein